MSEAEKNDTATGVSSVPPTDASDSFSKEYVQKLLEENAQLKHHKGAVEDSQRAEISSAHGAMRDWVSGLQDMHDLTPTDQAYLKKMSEWADGAPQSNNPAAEMALVKTIVVASNQKKQLKRQIDEASEGQGALRDVCSERDGLKTESEAKDRRIEEITALCDERQVANEELIKKLAERGCVDDKYNFSKTSAREQRVEASAGGSSAATAVAAEGGSANPFTQNDLAYFLKTNGDGGSRLMRAYGSNNSTIGAGSEKAPMSSLIGGRMM
jgi:hypothetical protein